MSTYTLQSPTINTDGVSFWALVNPDSTIIPYEYNGWKAEMHAWHEGVYVGTAISDTLFPYIVKGAGAVEFMNKYFTNNFNNVTPNRSKHGMMLNPNGNIYSYAYVGEIVPMSRINDAMGYTTAIYSLAFFATPFLVSTLMGITQGLVQPLYLGGAALGIVGIAIELATNGAYKKLQAEREDVEE